MESQAEKIQRYKEKARASKERAYLRYVQKADERKQAYYNKRRQKLMKEEWYIIKEIKEVARQDTWATNHEGCFRCYVPPAESPEHIEKKFHRWLHHRMCNHIVFTEVILANGRRADIIAADRNTGEIWIEEIVVSESQKSLDEKDAGNYPFEIRVVK